MRCFSHPSHARQTKSLLGNQQRNVVFEIQRHNQDHRQCHFCHDPVRQNWDLPSEEQLHRSFRAPSSVYQSQSWPALQQQIIHLKSIPIATSFEITRESGMMVSQSSFLFCTKLRKHLEQLGFKVNPNAICVANKMMIVKQLPVL